MHYKCTLNFIVLFVTYFISAQIQNPKNIPFNWKTDLSKHSVNLSEIQIVLPKGSFPALDFPEFIGKKEGLQSFYSK